ncbi:hypothetical protein [Stratiformator vulcanicus]|uniref:Glycoamylase-like domain-containing protein n=1 Tax=Stratiformator vulcanicus TaxID=2527980 RepID=A0A517R7P0_9PLAN|nr:hypothetical protein [Stratiformator vulcanicus]QDT39907.1 hypothetical protein Pan189_43190 [Stratiformator vulcanicus]
MNAALLLTVALTASPATDYGSLFERMTHANGLVQDRLTDRETVSCAATGFVAYGSAMLVEQGAADRDEVLDRLRRGFRTTVHANPARNRGWLAHFTDSAGRPKPYSEISTIDTAIFYSGYLRAAEILGDREFVTEVQTYLGQIDVDWMMRDGYFVHGFFWPEQADHPRWINHNWNDSSEGAILYHLFNRPFEPQVVRYDFPLFVYCYPLCFFDDARYEGYLTKAIDYQTRTFGYCGVTATDGPDGYVVDSTDVVSPLLLGSLAGKYPAAQKTLSDLRLDPKAPAVHLSTGWSSKDPIAIDIASALILRHRLEAQRRKEAASRVDTTG